MSETKTKLSPVEVAAQKKRIASRLFKLRQYAATAGISFTKKPGDENLEKYCLATNGVSVEVYCSDEYQEASGGARKGQANIDDLIDQIQLTEVNMNDDAIKAKTYKPWKTGTPFDKVASRHGGIYPASTIIMTGESGAGKTTLSLQLCALAQRMNKGCKALFLSGEMSFVDWQEECNKFPIIREVPVIYMRTLNRYSGNEYLAAIRKALLLADIAVVDSLVVIADRIKDATNMSAAEATFWLIDQMNEIAESRGKTFIAIQHFTKGGSYVGSTRLKHDTTAMIYCAIGENNQTCATYVKNRRGERKYLGKPMYFGVDESGINFDGLRFDEMMMEEEIKQQNKAQTISRTDLMSKLKHLTEAQAEMVLNSVDEDEDEF